MRRILLAAITAASLSATASAQFCPSCPGGRCVPQFPSATVPPQVMPSYSGVAAQSGCASASGCTIQRGFQVGPIQYGMVRTCGGCEPRWYPGKFIGRVFGFRR